MKQHPATPTRAAKVARAVATIMSIVLAFCTAMFTYQQNEISEKVGRIEALSKPLTYSVSASDDTDVELSFQESGQPTISAAGKTIDVVPATGGISQISSVVFANGTVAAINTLETPAEASNTKNATNVFWRINNYTIPILGMGQSGNAYGALYLVVKDSEGSISLNMITFTYGLHGESWQLDDCNVYNETDLLYCTSSKEFNEQNLDTFEAHQLEEFKSFKQLVDETIR